MASLPVSYRFGVNLFQPNFLSYLSRKVYFSFSFHKKTAAKNERIVISDLDFFFTFSNQRHIQPVVRLALKVLARGKAFSDYLGCNDPLILIFKQFLLVQVSISNIYISKSLLIVHIIDDHVIKRRELRKKIKHMPRY